MRKCYVKEAAGGNPAYWERFLGEADPDRVFNFTYNKYVRKFDRFIPPGAKILEGGCGLGQYVYYYSHRGFYVEGVDFSGNLIEKARLLNPEATLRTADIRNLPFADGSFDVYISNGVLEHFEEGPEVPLIEARRVLKSGGILIATLQYVNLARAIVDLIGFFRPGDTRYYRGANIEGEYRLVKCFAVENNPQFHSYFFSKKEAIDIFRKADFEITYVGALSVENGLGDFTFFRLRDNPLKASGDIDPRKRAVGKKGFGPVINWIKKTFIQEEPQGVIGLCLLRVLQACFGSMVLVVCRKR